MIQPFNPGIDQQVAQYQQTSAMNDQRGRGRGGSGGNPYARMADMENADRQRSHELEMLDRQSSLRAREGEAQRAHDVRQADLDRSHQTLLHDRSFKLQEDQIKRQNEREDRQQNAMAQVAEALSAKRRTYKDARAKLTGGLGAFDQEQLSQHESMRKELDDFEGGLVRSAAEWARQLDETGSRVKAERDKYQTQVASRAQLNGMIDSALQQNFSFIAQQMSNGVAGGLWDVDSNTTAFANTFRHGAEGLADLTGVIFGKHPISSAEMKGKAAYGNLPYEKEWLEKQQGAVVGRVRRVMTEILRDSFGGRSPDDAMSEVESFLKTAYSGNPGDLSVGVEKLVGFLSSKGIDPYLVAHTLVGIQKEAAKAANSLYQDKMSGRLDMNNDWIPGRMIMRDDLLFVPDEDADMANVAGYNFLVRMAETTGLAHKNLMDSALGGIETDAQLAKKIEILEELIVEPQNSNFEDFLRGDVSDVLGGLPNETHFAKKMMDSNLSEEFRNMVLGERSGLARIKSGATADSIRTKDERREMEKRRSQERLDHSRKRQDFFGSIMEELADQDAAMNLSPEARLMMPPSMDEDMLRILESIQLGRNPGI